MTIFVVVSVILVLKAIDGGTDINVYLFASDQLFKGENIYTDNPYNRYLYSPLFAILLRPLSILDFEAARAIWAIVNLLLAIRLWKVTLNLLRNAVSLDSKYYRIWSIFTLIIASGFLLHNINLGQITIVILWLTLEGLYQILIRKNIIGGAAFLALGINIKIIPFLALYYLFFKAKFKALILTTVLVAASLFLPSLIIGHQQNIKLLGDWAETINPASSRYVFENDNGTQSLSALLPAYFYDFGEEAKNVGNLKRTIVVLPPSTLLILMQVLRVLVLLSSLYLIFNRYKKRENKSLYFYWEFAYLALVSVLIFPHQQKYAMLYFIPAASYMLLFAIIAWRTGSKIKLKHKIIVALSAVLMVLPSLMGRDIVGNFVVNAYDFYHISGLTTIIFLFFLVAIKPHFLLQLNHIENRKTNSAE